MKTGIRNYQIPPFDELYHSFKQIPMNRIHTVYIAK